MLCIPAAFGAIITNKVIQSHQMKEVNRARRAYVTNQFKHLCMAIKQLRKLNHEANVLSFPSALPLIPPCMVPKKQIHYI